MNITDKLLTDLLYHLFKDAYMFVEYDYYEDAEEGIIIHYKFGYLTNREFREEEETFVSYLDIMAFIYNQIN